MGAEMDATGIRVAVYDRRNKALGHPVFEVPLGGGSCCVDEDLRIDVEPLVEMPRDRWRRYDEIQRLCARAEKTGGFARAGDTVVVEEEILVGRDAMEFVVALWRRASERSAYDAADYAHGYNDALDDLETSFSTLLEEMKRYPPES